MIKFVDKNRKDEYYSDELLIRCSCGCSIMSFRIAEAQSEEGEVLPILELVHFSNGFNEDIKPRVFNNASVLGVVDPQSVLTLYGLMTGTINNGHGYVQTQGGEFVGVDVDPDDHSLSIHCVEKEKDIHKLHQKGPQKAFKKIIWSLVFGAPEAEKLISFVCKMIEKKYQKLGMVTIDENGIRIEEKNEVQENG